MWNWGSFSNGFFFLWEGESMIMLNEMSRKKLDLSFEGIEIYSIFTHFNAFFYFWKNLMLQTDEYLLT